MLEQQTRNAVETAREETKRAVEAERQRSGQARTLIETAHETHRPGGVNLTVASPHALPEGYTVQLDGRSYRERVTGPTCGIVNLPPGLHELCVTAASADGPLLGSVAVKVEPNAVLEVALELACCVGPRS